MNSDCVEWQGTRTKAGYGQVYDAEQYQRTGHGQVYAHRRAYETTHGPLPKGVHVMHSCDNPACVNVAHLFAGTHRDNMRDMAAKGRGWNPGGAKTHCKHGHEFTPENTWARPTGGRRCRACANAISREYQRKQRASR